MPAPRRHRPQARRIDRFPATAYIAAMALRDILILPDKRLRQVSEPVKKVDAGIRALVEDMFETMYEAPGIGLAAIQVGTPKRVVTMDLAKKDEPKKAQVFINPEILWSSEELATCLQHEIDHINGLLFIDHLSKLKRSIALRKSAKLKRLDRD
jgi:peptide deformylase